MRSTAGVARGLIVLAFLAGGCSKLNEERSFELPLGEHKNFEIDPAKKEQKVHVQVTATDGKVDVFLCLEKDVEEAQRAFFADKKDKVLAGERKTNDAKLEATVPANTTAVVSVTNAGGSEPGKKTKVKLKITN